MIEVLSMAPPPAQINFFNVPGGDPLLADNRAIVRSDRRSFARRAHNAP